LPVKLFRRLDEGGKEVASEHASYKLAHDDANEWTSAAEFREQLTIDALLHGSGYAIVQRDDQGAPVELHRVDPQAVSVETNRLTNEPVYVIDRQRYGFGDVLHLKAPGGAAPIKACKEAIGLALILEKNAARLFASGGRPSGIVSVKSVDPNGNENVSADALKRVKAVWEAAFGRGKQGGTAFVPADTTYTPTAFTSVDAQFLEMREFQTVEIARALAIPPVLLQDYSRATWSNSEQMGRQFLQFTLLGWLRAWENAYRRALLTFDERATLNFEFIVDDLLRGDFASRVEGYAKLISSRVLNPNEVRALENRAPYAGGDEFVNPNTTSNTAPAPAAPEKEAACEHHAPRILR
jgi:HK97 family phage portal protein